MGAVQFVGRMGDQFGQPFRCGGRLDIPQLNQTLDLARRDAVEQGTLLSAGLSDPDFVEGGFACDRPGAVVAEGRGALAGQKSARACPDRHAANGSHRNPDVHQFRQLADQGRLSGLRTGGVAIDRRGARDLQVQALDLFQQAVGPFNSALDPAVGVFANRLNLAGDPAGLIEQSLGPEKGILTTRGRRWILGARREGRENGVDLREKAGVAARISEQRLDAVEQFMADAHARGLGPRIQAGRLQEPVGGEANA